MSRHGSPTVFILVGMIASGKSTWTRNFSDLRGNAVVVINDDSIVSAVHGGEYTRYEKSLKPLYKSIENHILSMALAMGRDVVVDRGVNISRQARSRFIAMTKSMDCRVEAVVMPRESNSVHADRRYHSDARGYPHSYWNKIAAAHSRRYEDVTESEGFDAIRMVDVKQMEDVK